MIFTGLQITITCFFYQNGKKRAYFIELYM